MKINKLLAVFILPFVIAPVTALADGNIAFRSASNMGWSQNWNAATYRLVEVYSNDNFWLGNYDVTGAYTHVGNDFHVAGCRARASSGCGNLLSPNYGEIVSVGSSEIRIRYLLDTGMPVYANFLHQNRDVKMGEAMTANTSKFIAREQLIGTEGMNGANNVVHQHLEFLKENEGSIWALTSSSYIGTATAIEDSLTPHVGISSSSTRNYYQPNSVLAKSILSPQFRRCDQGNCTSSSLYGVAGQILEGTLSLSRSQAANMAYGVVAHPITSGARITRSNDTSSSLGIDTGKWLVRSWSGNTDVGSATLTSTSSTSLTGSYSYPAGDYFFTPLVKNSEGTTKGYPVLMTVLPNSESRIVDNETTATADFELVKNTNPNFDVPGYAMYGSLLKSDQSGGYARWYPRAAGTYEVWVYISDGAAVRQNDLTTALVYKIKPTGANGESINATAINQSANTGRWVRLLRSGETNSTFNFTTDGYVGLSFSDTDNPDLISERFFVVDAVKFVSTATSNSGTGNNASWTTGAYSNNQDIRKTLSIPNASSLNVTITGRTESGYDYIYIYDANGRQIKKLSGTINERFTVSGSTITARLVSDFSVTYSGVTVTVSSSTGSTSTPTGNATIDKCINKFSTYFGSKSGSVYSCYTNYYCQDTSGPVTSIAVRKDLSEDVFYYNWGGWRYLGLTYCN